MLSKEQKYTEINLMEDGSISLRLTTVITDDGKVISKSHHREVRSVNDSLDDLPSHIVNAVIAYRQGL